MNKGGHVKCKAPGAARRIAATPRRDGIGLDLHGWCIDRER